MKSPPVCLGALQTHAFYVRCQLAQNIAPSHPRGRISRQTLSKCYTRTGNAQLPEKLLPAQLHAATLVCGLWLLWQHGCCQIFTGPWAKAVSHHGCHAHTHLYKKETFLGTLWKICPTGLAWFRMVRSDNRSFVGPLSWQKAPKALNNSTWSIVNGLMLSFVHTGTLCGHEMLSASWTQLPRWVH